MAVSRRWREMRGCRSAAFFLLVALAACRREEASFFAASMGIVVAGRLSQNPEALESALAVDRPVVRTGEKKSLLAPTSEPHAEALLPSSAVAEPSPSAVHSRPGGHGRGDTTLPSTVHSISPHQLRGGHLEEHATAFIKLKDTMRTVWESVKAGATKVKDSIHGSQVLAVMTSPALAGTASPLAMPPVIAPAMDVREATSMHGALIVLLCVAMVVILLTVVLVCFFVKRQKKHEKIMRMKVKDLAK